MYDQDRFSRHLLLLSFRDRDLEKQYHEHYKEIHIIWGRVAVALGVILYSAFLYLDKIIMPDAFFSQVAIRLFIVTPCLFAILLLSMSRRLILSHMQIMGAMSVLMAGMGHFAMALYSHAGPAYIMGTTAIVVCFLYTFAGLRFKYTLPLGMFLIVCYEITEIYLMKRTKVDILFYNYFLLSLNFVGIFSSYTIDRLQGVSFVQNMVINEEKKKREEIITELEQSQEALNKTTAALQERSNILQKSMEQIKDAQALLFEFSKMAEVGRMVAGVAREIDTPLNFGANFSSVLNSKLKRLAGRAAGEVIAGNELEKNLKTMGNTADIVLDNLHTASDLVKFFKQFAEDQSDGACRQFNLKKYIDGLLRILQHQYKAAGHKIVINCSDALDITGHPDLFAQIILKLLTNSIDHGLEGIIDCRLLA